MGKRAAASSALRGLRLVGLRLSISSSLYSLIRPLAAQAYISHFQFQSIDTATFLSFLHARLPDLPSSLDLPAWIDGPGLPPNAPVPRSAALDKVKGLAAAFPGGARLTEEDHRGWQVTPNSATPPCGPCWWSALGPG